MISYSKNSIKLIFNPAKCLGCMACVIICAFHHTKKINPYFSSIEITHDHNPAILKFKHYKSNEGTHIACDSCVDEEKPLCVDICPSEGIYLDE